MPHRIEVELTSQRDDGRWTWRAAGAKKPKGELDGSLLPEGAKVGDVLRAEADMALDGIGIVSVLPSKERQRNEPERIEILGTGSDSGGVTTQLVEKRGGRGRGGDRRDRGDRDRGDRGSRRDGGGRRDRNDRGDRGDRPRGGGRSRPERPAPEAKPKRLRAGRAHRNEVLRRVAPEQRPMAELVLKGGIPGVRAAIERMDEAGRAHGQPPVAPEPLLALAEQLLPHLRMAEWHDRADAALADVDELDLRDLRQVVVAADANARDETTRELAGNLRDALGRRVDAEHAAWLAELTELLDEGRVVRALRLSSRPPKAGAMFPAELATRLVEGATASLGADVSRDRYGTVLDALAYSPVRAQVVPEHVPDAPGDELLATVRKLADRIPQVAAAFGVEPTPAKARRSGRGRGAGRSKGKASAKAGSGSSPAVPPPPASASPDPAAPTAPTAPTSPTAPTDDAPTATPDEASASPTPAPAADVPDPGTPPAASPESVAAAADEPGPTADPGTPPAASPEPVAAAADEPGPAADPGTPPAAP